MTRSELFVLMIAALALSGCQSQVQSFAKGIAPAESIEYRYAAASTQASTQPGVAIDWDAIQAAHAAVQDAANGATQPSNQP